MLQIFLFLTTCCLIVCWTSCREHNHYVVVFSLYLLPVVSHQYCYTNLDKGEPREKWACIHKIK